jgi:uncharacterized membrane protein YraQ (UPF0718 family)/YHS domain-containing protein
MTHLAAVTAVGALVDLGRSLREAFYMLWDTLWALVLGFTLSGAVQAFVSRRQMQRHLGDHHPASIARASIYGMVSSSCSYAASAMARSLVARGADFVAAMVFLFASTNLVIELGIVLLVLIGWQFLAAELIGGIIMIVLLAILGSLWLRGKAVVRAQQVVAATGTPVGGADERTGTPADAPHCGGGADTHADADDRPPWRQRIRSAAGWSDAAGYTMSDLAMLRKELAIGFVVAGLLTVLVPAHLWADLFVRGHGSWTDLENAVVGPFVAIISFVCSVGNVPLAAALWHGGISFGGVVAFVFADLVTFPLLLIYRKQYGAAMAARMLALFWLVMSAAGLATQYLFRAAGWVPTARHGVVAGDTLRWNPTTVLDIVALVGFGALTWLYRNRDRLGGGAGYAKDPVCGMQVEKARAPATAAGPDGHLVYFCSERCRDRFAADGRRQGASGPDLCSGAAPGTAASTVDPVCGMTVDPSRAAAHRRTEEGEHWFCSAACAASFDRQAQAHGPQVPGATH